ncbi:aldehyde dehydrogenase family protein [Dongia deserti]|uniref:aldehyde dehydrogenase family protein n=1 Tax=Dongia deserti TaxID=2268030 RepID=UPI000E655662|nr:aldehyde dehydrogenase family protein [Dongia deserti]
MAIESRIRSLIDGQDEPGGSVFTLRDKYLGTELAEVETANAHNVTQAVAAARRAFAGTVPPPHRRFAILSDAARLLEARRPLFSDTLVAEAGFTLSDAASEIDRAILTLGLCAEQARQLHGDMVALDASPGQEKRIAFTMRTPIGIVCAITPFNSPLNVVLHKIAPALAAGNAVIVKPSGHTPKTAVLLARLLIDAGLPPGLIGVLHDQNGEAAQALLAEQDIGFYTFTGSTRVGRLIQNAAGLRRTQLELGSIASTIVCGDADLDLALPKIANAAFRKAGQVCTSVQRLYVQAPIYEDVLERIIAIAAAMPAGDPRDAKTRVGPMISEDAAVRVESVVRQAALAGAEIRCGGQRSGAVHAPTILVGTVAGMRVMDEEIFGPVLSVIPFTVLEEAVHGANDTPYGLSVGVFTRDIGHALKAARTLRFGAVHINETSSARADAMPFGGVKDSGFGREGPAYAIREYTEERLITVTC